MGSGIGYGSTAAQRQELWDRYQRGESLKAIARALGKGPLTGVGSGFDVESSLW
jgi:hypothetical protein